MFKKKFKVVDINFESGVITTYYLEGNKRDVLNDIEEMKKTAKSYEFFGKEGMVVWRR